VRFRVKNRVAAHTVRMDQAVSETLGAESVREVNPTECSRTGAGDPHLPPPRPSDVHDASKPRLRRSSIIGSACPTGMGRLNSLCCRLRAGEATPHRFWLPRPPWHGPKQFTREGRSSRWLDHSTGNVSQTLMSISSWY
jgi:hypothetical protein